MNLWNKAKKMLKAKKGAFDVGDLYNFVLLLILVGIGIGVGVLVLDKFSTSSGITPAAIIAINASRDEISNLATQWLGIIVIVVVAAIILGIVIRNLGNAR